MYLFGSYEAKMLMLKDFDLNSVERYTDSHKDIFKLTMLDQEILFRKQVHELHCSYGVQQSLMKDFPLHECEKYNSWKANDQSWPQETRFPSDSVFMLSSKVSSSQKLLEGWKGNNCHNFQQRPSNLRLLPKQYINLGDDNLPNKRKVLQDGDFWDPLELRLSLSLGVAKGKKEETRRSWYDKKTNKCPVIVIDLEESSDEDTKHPPFDFATKITSDPITSRSMKKDLSYEIAESSSFLGDSKCYQDVSCSNHGSKRQNNMPPENFLTRKRQFISYGVGQVDLNEVQLDLNDAITAHPPTTTSSSGGFRGLVSKSRETLYLATFDLNSELDGMNECETSFISPASVSMTQLNLSQDHGHLNPARVIATPVGCVRTEEGDTDKIEITIEDEHPDEYPTSGKSSCISDIDSIPVRTSHSGTYNLNLPASDQFSGTNGRSQVAETFSSELDQRSSDSNEIKHECNDNREESAELDDLVQIAAESLINLSLESSAFYQESSTPTKSSDLENGDKEQARCPSDFFELMTLELTESSAADDYFISSKPFEVSELEGKDFGIKLRRGRRMKDFQRDILPGLASLSRHEICEDINILEGVLRSREYKKMRAKMGNGDTWCAPMTRGKRSRLGRKNF